MIHLPHAVLTGLVLCSLPVACRGPDRVPAAPHPDAVIRSTSPADPTPDEPCYSPSLNVGLALERGSSGCPCDPKERGVCAETPSGALVPLECIDGRWRMVVDGACGW